MLQFPVHEQFLYTNTNIAGYLSLQKRLRTVHIHISLHVDHCYMCMHAHEQFNYIVKLQATPTRQQFYVTNLWTRSAMQSVTAGRRYTYIEGSYRHAFAK